jgi:hypothetical protein
LAFYFHVNALSSLCDNVVAIIIQNNCIGHHSSNAVQCFQTTDPASHSGKTPNLLQYYPRKFRDAGAHEVTATASTRAERGRRAGWEELGGTQREPRERTAARRGWRRTGLGLGGAGWPARGRWSHSSATAATRERADAKRGWVVCRRGHLQKTRIRRLERQGINCYSQQYVLRTCRRLINLCDMFAKRCVLP